MDNNDGVLKAILALVVVAMLGFMGWAVITHNQRNDLDYIRYQQQLDRENCRHRDDELRHDHNREYMNQWRIDRDRNRTRYDKYHREYYCPQCKHRCHHCPHYRQYDPYFSSGYYYCPQCRTRTRSCPHTRHHNPYLEIHIR